MTDALPGGATLAAQAEGPRHGPVGPESIGWPGLLLLWFASARGMGRALTALRAAARDYRIEEGCVRLVLADGEAPACVAGLLAALSPREAEQTRALFVPGRREARLPDFGGVVSLHALDVVARSTALVELLAGGHFTSWFHPIVEARAPYRVLGHEALFRGFDGQGGVQAPEPLFALARDSGLLPALDTAACRSAIRAAVRHLPEQLVFINFSPAAVEDPADHLAELALALGAAGLPRERVVFEVVEADRLGDVDQLEALLRGYREAGFRVALDDLGAGWSTLNLVHRLRPDFIKLDRELVRHVEKEPVKATIAGKLLEICRGLGIASIVEGVEDLEELRWVCAHGADFVQGFLFGRPSEVPLQRPAFA